MTYSSTVTNAGASLATNVTLTQTFAGQGVRGHAVVQPGRMHDQREPAGDVQSRTAGAECQR